MDSNQKNCNSVDSILAPYGLLILRLAIGVDWIVHALLKTSLNLTYWFNITALNTPYQPLSEVVLRFV